jgi:hypothetical protein
MASLLSPSGMALWGGSLPDQLDQETEEQRKRRLVEEAQRKALGPTYGAASRTLGLGSYGSTGRSVMNTGGY